MNKTNIKNYSVAVYLILIAVLATAGFINSPYFNHMSVLPKVCFATVLACFCYCAYKWIQTFNTIPPQVQNKIKNDRCSSIYNKYTTIDIVEMRPVTQEEIDMPISLGEKGICLTPEDMKSGCPKAGDMIARDPENHKDMWLVEEDYFKRTFKRL